MKAEVTERAEILTPNKEHKNFTGTGIFLEKGESIEGEPKVITGLRKGKPFDYRLFELKNNKLIYLNKTNINNNMKKATEVTLGADGANATPTVIDTKPTGFSLSSHPELFGTLIGALVGFAYSHTMKHEPKKKAMYTAGAAAIGLGVGAFIKHRRAIVITPSK